MKKLLITGASGFIGRQVTKQMLKRGYTVYAPSTAPIPEEQEGVVQSKLDLFDREALRAYLQEHKFENLIHLAWSVGPTCYMDPCNADWLSLSLDMIKEFMANGGKKFLGAGSVFEYDFSYGLLREDKTPLENPSLYGQSKAALYKTGSILCRQAGVDFKWARIFNLYGPYERAARLMPSVICSILKHEDVKVSPCTKFLDYLHVEDTASGIAMLFESPVTGAVNISSGQPIQLRVIVEEIARQTGFNGQIRWGALEDHFTDPVLAGVNERLTKEVGWKPNYTLTSGLEQTINWWKEHLK